MTSSDQLFRSIYERYYPYLLKKARILGVDEKDAEDLVQETFVAYYRNYPLTWQEYQIHGALEQILRNRSIDYHRKRNRHPQDLFNPQEAEETGFAMDKLTEQDDALAILLENEKYQVVWDGLNKMRKDWAQVFILHFIRGIPMKEVGELLGTTEAACRVRVTRGRKFLREHLRKNS
ncbi:MAG: RNA polymerase sigma factor [Lachnospiraceae bacterium]